jgi:hypothetical protein
MNTANTKPYLVLCSKKGNSRCLKQVSLSYTVKKVSGFPVPLRDVTYQTLPVRMSSVSDVPAGDGKIGNLF